MFVVFRGSNEYMRMIFEGYCKRDVLVDKDFSRVLSLFNAFHNSISWNQCVKMPLKSLWYPFYLNYNKLDSAYKNGDNIFFIFFEGNRLAYQKDYLLYLRDKYPNCKLIFRYINIIVESNKLYLPFIEENYDLVISMDKNDCRHYGWMYVPNTYELMQIPRSTSEKTDIIFLGNDKGRHRTLVNIYRVLEEQGIKCDFYISGVPEQEKNRFLDGIHYIDFMGYREYLERLQNARCILEVLASGQVGSSLRALEAVYFDKILLSNNKQLLEEAFYNRKYMMVFDEGEKFYLPENYFNRDVKYGKKSIISHQKLFNKIQNYFL